MHDFTKRVPTYRMHFQPAELPYQHYINEINEALHIFKKDDIKYNYEIKSAVDTCISNLNDASKNLIKLYKHRNILFDKVTIKNLLSSLENVDLYIGVNNQFKNKTMDVINSTYNFTDDINDKYIPLAICITPGEYKKISIIAEISPQCLYTEKYINILISSIHHELIHVLHDIKLTNLSINAGNAFYYSTEIIKLAGYKFDFIDLDILKKMYNNISYIDPLLIFGAALYYCDKSELCAWHETVYNEIQEIMRCANNPVVF